MFLQVGEGSLSRGALSRGLCPEGKLCPGGVSVQGSLSRGSLSRGDLCQWGVSVRETPYSNVRAVRILLECILVFTVITSDKLTYQIRQLRSIVRWFLPVNINIILYYAR